MHRFPQCDIVHVAPFDAGQYPPLLNTVKISKNAGVSSCVIASVPLLHPALFDGSRLVVPPRRHSASGQLAFLTEALGSVLRGRVPQLVIAHNVLGLLAAWHAKAFDAAPLVYHCHDFETSATHPMYAAERTAVRRVAELWVPAPERRAVALERGFTCATRVVRNCPPRLAELPERGALLSAFARRTGMQSVPDKLITRHGRVGRAHYVLETIEALPRLSDDVGFAVIGSGDDGYVAECESRACDLGVGTRVLFHGFVPHSALNALLVDGRVGMCVYAPLGPNEEMPAPNKVYENLALGIPAVVGQGNSVEADVITSSAGTSVPVGDIDALVNALGRLIDDEGAARSARAAHLDQFNYEAQHATSLLGRLMRARYR